MFSAGKSSVLFVVLATVLAQGTVAQTNLLIEPDTLFYSADQDILLINTGPGDLTLQRLALSTTNAHEWIFELDANNVISLVNLNAIEHPEEEIDVTISSSDTAYLRVRSFDPCIVCGGKRAAIVGPIDTLVVYSSAPSSPDTVALDLSVYLPAEHAGGFTSAGVLAEMYPNPVGSTLFARLTVTQPADLEAALFDVAGRLVQDFSSRRLGPGDNVVTLELARVPDGVYMLRLSVGGPKRAKERRAFPLVITQ